MRLFRLSFGVLAAAMLVGMATAQTAADFDATTVMVKYKSNADAQVTAATQALGGKTLTSKAILRSNR
jgi:hypothetical protein